MVLTFFIVMFILLMHFLWMHIGDLLGKGLPFTMVLQLVMYASATLIPLGLPLATLLASIMTMGNLGENNELLALKAAGISLPRIVAPLAVLMLVVCACSFFFINNVTPYAQKQVYGLLVDISKQEQELQFKDGIFFDGVPNMSIRVDRQEPNGKLLNVLIYDTRDYKKMQTTVADSGYIRLTDDRQYLDVKMYNGQMYEKNRDFQWFNKDTMTYHTFERQELLIPLSGFNFARTDMEVFSSNSDTKTMGELKVAMDSIRPVQDSLINVFTDNLLRFHVFRGYTSYSHIDSIPVRRASPYIAGDMDTMNTTSRNKMLSTVKQWMSDAQNFVNYRSSSNAYTSTQLYAAELNYQRKLSLPFSVMIFFLIGAPLGAIIRKGGLGMPIVVSVIFFVIYYIITIIGEKMVKDGALPAYIGMWLSSFILFPIAIFLTYKSTNDSALLNSEAYINKYKKLKKYINKIVRKIRKWIKF